MFLSSKKRTLAFFYTRKAFSQIWPRTLFTVTRSLFQMTIKTYPQIQVLVSPSFFVWMYYLIFLNGNASKCLSRYGVILGSNQSGFKIGKLLQWPSKKKARKNCRSIWRKIFTKMTNNNNNRQNGGWYFAYSRRLTWKSCCWSSTDRIWVRSQWWGSRRSCAAGLRRTRCRFGSDV